MTQPNMYKRHRIPPEIIQKARWFYYSFNLGHRDVEDLLGNEGNREDPIKMLDMVNVSVHIKRPVEVARRKPCKDFEKYESLFVELRELLLRCCLPGNL
jgi:hypothetical protein